MLGLDMLDVAIGIVFVYLLLSLIASAAVEGWEALRKVRAVYLERGIIELLRDTQLVKKLYEHPLINGLYEGNYGEPKTKLPSYIPTRSFALAIMDLLLPSSAGATPAQIPANTTPEMAAARPTVDASAMKMMAAVAPKAQDAAPASSATAPSTAATSAPAPTAAASTDPYIDQARHAVVMLVDAAGHDAEQARKNIEDWYNTAMDRVSGWYKRRTHLALFVIGLVIAIVLNVDSIRVVTALSTDKPKRDAVVGIATAYSKANPNPPAAATDTTGGTKSGPGSGVTNTMEASTTKPPAGSLGSAPAPVVTNTTTGSAKPGADGSGGTTSTTTTSPATTTNGSSPSLDAAAAQTREAIDELDQLGLPIGWKNYGCALCDPSGLTDCKPPAGTPTLSDKFGYPHWIRCWLLVLVGWLMTALAVSLGAPFWFDSLNKLITVRSTVKPQDKGGSETASTAQKKS
jgi:hypothetical protein